MSQDLSEAQRPSSENSFRNAIRLSWATHVAENGSRSLKTSRYALVGPWNPPRFDVSDGSLHIDDDRQKWRS